MGGSILNETPTPPATASPPPDRVPFLERLARDVLVLDGATGTELYRRGLSFQDCFDAANLDQAEWVLEIHRSYLEAGSDAIQTNTFGANRYRLAKFRREADLQAILEAGGALARQAAGESRYVVGSLGPLGVEIEPLGRLERAEALAAFREAAAVLAPFVDAFALETFSNPEEAVAALRGVREASDKPVIANFTVDANGKTLHGTLAEIFARRLEDAGADVIGLNCSTGPKAILETILRISGGIDRPLAASPNAGMPTEVDGRVIYESSPDYFARFARRFLQAGGRILGGCCGTTPEHVRAMVRAARMVGSQVRREGRERDSRPFARIDAGRPLAPKPLAERSALGRALAAGAGPTSIELLPPRTPDMTRLCAAAERIRDAGATVINIPDGPRASARISNLAAALILREKVGVEILLHFCCRDRNLLGMQSDLMGMAALGLHNVLVITGDPPYVGNYPDVTAVFDVDAIGLCHIVDNLNHGLDLGGNEVGAKTDFCLGAALNPTSLDLDRELDRFDWKSKAGIDFAITQPIFDVAGFRQVLERLPAGAPPVLAGVWPLRSKRNAEFLASEVPGVVVPKSVLERMRAADRVGRAAEEGVHLAIETVQALAGVVAGFQIAAPFNKPGPALEVLAAVPAPRTSS